VLLSLRGNLLSDYSGVSSYALSSNALAVLDLRSNLLPSLAVQYDVVVISWDTVLFDLPTQLTYPAATVYDMTFLADPIATDYQGGSCPSFDPPMFWHRHLLRCMPCLPPFLCDPTVAAVTTNQNIRLSVGFYPTRNTTNSMTVQLYADDGELPIWTPCFVSRLCNPASHYTFECAAGHDVNSFLCSACSAGYFAAASDCFLCPPRSKVWLPIIIVILVLLLVAGAHTLKVRSCCSNFSIVAL